MDLVGPLPKTPDRLEDVASGLGPLERAAVFIVRLDILVDGGTPRRDTREGPALERVRRQPPEEAFHQVEPRGVGRREVELKARVSQEPSLDRRSLVGRRDCRGSRGRRT